MRQVTKRIKLGGMKRSVTLFIPTSDEDRIPKGSMAVRIGGGYENIEEKIDRTFDLIKGNGMRNKTYCDGERFKDHHDWVYYKVSDA